MKEKVVQQYQHLDLLDKQVTLLKHISRVNPHSRAEEVAKKRVFKHYYGSTRFISRDEENNLKIEVDWEMVGILAGKNIK